MSEEMYEPTGTRRQRQLPTRSMVLKFVQANFAIRNVSKRALCKQIAQVINYNQSFVFGPKIEIDCVDVRKALTKLHAQGKVRCEIADDSPLYAGKHFAVTAPR